MIFLAKKSIPVLSALRRIGRVAIAFTVIAGSSVALGLMQSTVAEATPALYTEGFTFSVAHGYATVTGLTGGCEGKFLVVPADDGAGHPVAAIGVNAFEYNTIGCHITGVSLPPTVTTIGSNAFAMHRTLTEINIPASVTSIESGAFYRSIQWFDAAKIYFEGERPGFSNSTTFYDLMSSQVYYNSGQTGWPGENVGSATPQVSQRVAQETLSMTSPTSGLVGTPLTLTSSGGSGWGGVVYQQDGNDCVLSGNVLSRASAGSCTVRVSKSPTSTFNRANSSWETINFAIPLPQASLAVTSIVGVAGTPLSLTSSGGSGNGAVTYAVTNGTATDCAESGGVLTATGFGTCNVTATKAGDSPYLPISSQTVEVSFYALTQEPLTFPSSRTGPIGTPIALTLWGGSGTGLVTYAVANGTATGCAESFGALRATSVGTCSVSATKAADATYAETSSATLEFTFSLLEQDELVVTSTSGVAGTPLTLTYSGGSGTGAVSYMLFTFVPSSASDCVVENGTVSASSAGTCNVAAYKAGSGNFNEAYGYGAVTFAAAPTTTTTEPSTTTTQPSNTSTTTTQPSNTSTTTTTVPPLAESVVVGLPRAETPLVADNSLSVGAELTVTFSGFAPGEFVQLIVASTPQVIDSGYANAQGVVTLSGKIPTDLASGNHTLAVYAPESGTGFNQPITVTGLVLPATGSSGAGVLYGWAMLMILLGVIWHFIGRRRTRA